MAQTIKIKRSAVPSKVPTTSDLALGELGLNTYDGKLYTKKDNGTASIVELSGGGGGAKGGGSDDVFYENSQTVTANYTLTTAKNAMTAGPVSIDAGVTVTVPAGASWVIV
jgi:hypothetical protein